MKKIMLVLVLIICIMLEMFVPIYAGAEGVTAPPMIVAGDIHTVALKKSGEVWAWGDNSFGQLGSGTDAYVNDIPVKAKISEVKQISSGSEHTVALKENGEVWAWGNNNYGQLGDGTTANSKTPVKVNISDVKQIAAGYKHTVALKENGEVWTWGRNNNGQLGNGTATDRQTPVKVDISEVKRIFAGSNQTIAIKENGEVWAWGYNNFGQLGDGTTTDRHAPVKSNIYDVKQISMGETHIVLVKENGEVWAWGRNNRGQLGNGTFTTSTTPVKVDISEVKQVSAGYEHTVAVKRNGEVWAWGRNDMGQVGDGTTKYYVYTPVKVNISGVREVSTGLYHTVALKSNGEVWTWGFNYYGQLGDKTLRDRYKPVKANIKLGKAAFAEMKYNGITYDLLSQPINIDKESDAEISVKVNYEDATGKEKIYISQNTLKSVELENNIYKTFKPTEVFDADNDLYIIIINEETGECLSQRTRLKIVDNEKNGEWLPSSGVEGLNFKLGNKVGFTVPEGVPIFENAEINWDFGFIPISVEYDREDNNKLNIVFGTNIMSGDGKEDKYFKDFDFDAYKKDFKKAASKQGRTLKQVRNDFKISKAHKMSFFGEKVLAGGTGEPSFDFDVAGYAEARIIDGNLTFVEGQLCLEAEASYTCEAQAFIWVVPLYLEIGGGIGAGFEGNMINIDPETFAPQFEAYLTAKIKAILGAGVGLSKITTVGISGEGTFNLKSALHKDYLKAWGEGDAIFKVKVFGKEVAKKEFAKGDFLVYETGNANGLISDSAVKLLSSDDDTVYSQIDINKVYENESRLYASSSTKWHGNIHPISLMDSDYKNKNLQLLAENVYTESEPMMCDIDGQKVMVMLWDNNERDAINRTMVVYSVYDNETNLWSSPVPVCDDGTADFYPCFNDGYLVWQNEKSQLDNSMTLLDIAKLGEICVSKWNGNGFDEPVTITDNDVIDTQPYVCASDSKVSVIWTTNSENDIIGTSGRNSILKSVLTDSNWSEAVTVKDNLNSIVNLSAGFTDDGLNIAYVADGDNDLQTINERDICIITENEEYKLTDNDVLDSNPVFEGNMIYYYSNGNIEYIASGSEVKNTIFKESKADLTDAFTVDANEAGDIAIWWAKNTDNATEIFGTLYKDGEWSDEIQISDTGNQARYPSGILKDDGSMYVAYNNSIWQDGEIVQSDLYTIDLLPSCDLSVVDAYIDEDSMMVYATIKNTGEINIDSYTLSLIDGNVNSQKVISEGLKAGESAEVEIEYIKPENFDKRTITFAVSVDAEEYNSDNNSKELTVGNCDVNITEVINYEMLPDSQAVAVISNNGYSDTGKITVSLRKEKADGVVAETQIIDNLSAGESTEVTFDYSIVENSNIQWYVTAEAENKEISSANNDAYFINNYLYSVSEYSHKILRYSVKENSLIINAYSENNTDTDLTAVSILAVYDVNGKLKAVGQKDLTISKYDSSTVDFTIDNYTYASGDYVKIFMWNKLNNLKPLLNAEKLTSF